ncbi:CapA family protein [Pseudoalteromonas tetraodonis]|uniref:CapA family protein n=1 Tax=Pseudoalteromonas tetraodonis TaxID=43659 RepID=UPI001BDED893|nr:CapA family protein [Pseudoalteromonas tetraodonis]MBT2152926.1 CapA family protein [Pseudoalteromonas tetraodonis]
MFIFGDFALPYNKPLTLPFELSEKSTLLINNEGYLVDEECEPNFAKGVHVNLNALRKLGGNNSLVLALANNHVMDEPNGVTNSMNLAHKYGYKTVGAGNNLAEAIKPLLINEDGLDIAIINAGWDLIGCKYASERRQGVHPLDERAIIKLIKQQKENGCKVLVYLHWGYETERYPLPLHREMAHRFVDAGADFIIGCHAHCLQGYELYNNTYIFYGIGNFAFQQKHYYEGMLGFPSYCDVGATVNWDARTNDVTVILMNYDSISHKLDLISSGKPESLTEIQELSSFSHLSSKGYIKFFQLNRVKRKGLPIFSGKDFGFSYNLKFSFVYWRGKLIDFLVFIGVKSR